jgi:hypothetical protein
MLIMGDLQLITGLAIIISGFAQLRCGISTYHWQRVVNTAWFACATHLCCLTFLREHLIHNRIAQLWRVPGMIVLTIMIIYALTTTSQYDWESLFPNNSVAPSDQAICYLDPSFEFGNSHLDPSYLNTSFNFQLYEDDRRLRLVVSIIFLGFGMINRLRRLYHAPNLIVSKARAWVSRKVRSFLMHCYGRICADSFIACAAAVLVYRPLLALFLTVRILMDGLTSLAFEVRRHATNEP